jgi:hypothetical protein
MSVPNYDSRVRTESEPLLPCPLCPVRLQRRDMVKHLWLQHRLLLDGQRAREPWAVVEDWAQGYRDTGDRQLLVRCLDLVRHLDAEHGADRLQQVLAGRQRDPFAEARRCGGSLCPHCFALLRVAAEPAVVPVTLSHGRIRARGYRVEISERGLTPILTLESPQGVVFRGPEGSRRWTHRGAIVLFVWPPALLALVLALVLRALDLPAAVPVVLALAVAVLAYLYIRIRGLFYENPLDRAVDHAWIQLVPRLHHDSFSAEDSEFLAGLALASIDRGHCSVRARVLEQLLNQTEKATRAGQAPLTHLAALWRLAVADAAATGTDPVTLVARQISRCLEGAVPLVFAEHLLGQWEASWWGRGNLARLRVLVCERAFEAGFEVGDLLQAGRLVPALGDILEIDRPLELARLRFLWSVRAASPWSKCGEAVPVFELAAHATLGEEHLERNPDLLLLPAQPPAASVAMPAIRLCAHGIAFGDASFSDTPRTIEVKTLKPTTGGARYQLLVDDRVFWFEQDPDQLALRLERWCHYFFRDFACQADTQPLNRISSAGAQLRAREAKACPECGKEFVPSRGNLGLVMS